MLQAVSSSSQGCYFIADRATSVETVDYFADALIEAREPLPDPPTYAVTAKKYSLSGANCETVSLTGTDVVDEEMMTPAGGKGVENCAFLIHFSLEELSGEAEEPVMVLFNVLYGYKAQYFDGTNPNASSFASFLSFSVLAVFFTIFSTML